VIAVFAVVANDLRHVRGFGEANDEPLGFDQRGTTLAADFT
jgi:hypothetical protein